MTNFHALWHLDEQASIIQEAIPKQKNALKIKALYSLISLGTERLVASGKVPAELYDRMRVPYQEGDFSFPIKYGYSLVGEVLNTRHPLYGKRVHVLHPHQDYCWVDEKDVFVLPENVDSQVATLASNLETAINGVWDSGVNIGDRVLLVGFGLIGSLLARLLEAIPGVQLEILDVNPQKVNMAQSLGFKAIADAEALSNIDYDVAFHCSASAQGLQTCIDRTGFESKIIELSWYGMQSTPIRLGGSFHQQRKQLISSQVAHLPTDRRGRWDTKRRKELIFNLLKMPIFKHHISQTLKFADVPKLFTAIRANKVSELGVCIDYQAH